MTGRATQDRAAKLWHRLYHGHWPFYRPDVLPEWAAGICVRCIKSVELVEVRGAAGTGEGGEDLRVVIPPPEPRCNGLDTGCTATPDCPVHMGAPA
jgi:hypothetical protein